MQHGNESFLPRSGRIWLGAALSATVLGLGACSQPEPTAEPVRSVKVIQVGVRGLQGQSEYAGEVKARVESALGFRVSGKLISRQVQLGQTVQAGQVLAQLDPQDYRLATQAAQAQAVAAQTNRDLAGADFKRFQDLFKQGFISATELDRREAALKAAQAQWEQAQAQATAQGHQGDYTTLRADVSGVVTSVDAEPGQVVAAGTPVVRLAQAGARDAVFALPEDKLGQFAVGSKVQVRAWGAAQPVAGSVRERGAAADPVTRTIVVKVALPSDFSAPLGSTVSVLPQDGASNASAQAILLPLQALRQEGKNTAVWVLDTNNMQVNSVPVSVSGTDANEAVIASGLKPGQWVVSTGVHVLTPGQKVNLYQERGSVTAPPIGSASAPARPASAMANASAAKGA